MQKPPTPQDLQAAALERADQAWEELFSNLKLAGATLRHIWQHTRAAGQQKNTIHLAELLRHPNCPRDLGVEVWDSTCQEGRADTHLTAALARLAERIGDETMRTAAALTYLRQPTPISELAARYDKEQLRQISDLTADG